jgi:hypothetical protein
MEESSLGGVLYPLFSPDLSHSHFFLFGYVKGKLQGAEFTEKDDLLANIRDILTALSGEVLNAEFIEWGKGLQTCIDAGGEYVE